MSKIVNRIFKAGAANLNPAASVNNMLSLYRDVSTLIETEKTKRADIIADKEVKIEAIRSQRDFFMSYLQKTFDERADNFSEIFKVIDTALENGNIQQLALSLDSLNKLAAESPFKVIADINALGEALNNKMEFDL
jgi:hypothetical protein